MMEIEKPKPYRLQMPFWLDRNREDERELGWYLEEQKKRHKYTATIRDGVRLIWSLREGRADILLELFPNVEDMINRQRLKALMRSKQRRGYDPAQSP